VIAPRVGRSPFFREQLINGEAPALRRSELVVRPRLRRTLAGQLCPNAVVAEGRRFDDLAAGRFAVVTSAEPSAAQRAAIERRGAVVVAAPPGGELHRWLRRGGARAAVVRPDGTVLNARVDLTKVCANLPAFHTRRGPVNEGHDRPDPSRPLHAPR
jgi:3-(3-hydroxy-phenyl)propionate hydroxylase